jgi:hypothetical protein
MMNIVIVSYYYPPSEGPAGERLYFFAKKLSERRCNVIVLSANLGGGRYYPDLENVKHIQVGECPSFKGERRFNAAKKVLSFFKIKFHLLKSFNFLFNITPHGKWKSEVIDRIKSGNIKLPGNVDYVISSFPDRSSIDVGKIVSSYTGAKWIIDYRDLWSINHYSAHSTIVKSFLVWKEKEAIKDSKALIFASDSLMNDFKVYFNLSMKMISIYNGYNPLDSNIIKCKNKGLPFSIVYTGSLYGGKRDVTPFFNLLEEIPDSVFTIYLLSYVEDGKYINSVIPNHLSNRVLVRYEVPHNETIEVQKCADILALIVMNDGCDSSYPTAKIFEYMKTGIQIVSNASKNSEIDKILLETGSGCLIDEFKHSDRVEPLAKKNILKYSREVQNEKLYNLLESLK